MVTKSITIKHISKLHIFQQAQVLGVSDFIDRKYTLTLPLVEDSYSRILVALKNYEPIAWLRFFPRRLLLYRDPNSSIERLLPAALIEFPITEHFIPELWSDLFDYAFGELFQQGSNHAGIYIPPEMNRHSVFLKNLGFNHVAECDSRPFLENLGFDKTCSLWVRKCQVARGYLRPDIYPEIAESGILYAADVSTAPNPDMEFWSQALIYSGYSGYPYLPNIFGTLIPSNVQKLLNVPCATGDIFRLLPVSNFNNLKLAIGVDIVQKNLEFAKVRLKYPQLDLLNMIVCHAFFRHRNNSLDIPIEQFISQLAHMCGRQGTSQEISEYYLQMDAAFGEVVLGGAITDWFALLKGLGRLLAQSPEPDIFISGGKGINTFDYCELIAKKIDENGIKRLLYLLKEDKLLSEVSKSGYIANRLYEKGIINFINADMFKLNLNVKFDCIFIWEAMLMVVGIGLENEFLSLLDNHLAKDGILIITGIRRPAGTWPQELYLCQKRLYLMNYNTQLTSITPQTSPWAFGYSKQINFPVLLAKKKGE